MNEKVNSIKGNQNQKTKIRKRIRKKTNEGKIHKIHEEKEPKKREKYKVNKK